MLSWTISRRRVVQRCPQVPTAEKTIARVVSSKSADGVTIMPLLPPSSSSERPKRLATRCATARPIAVEPVAEINGNSWASASASPTPTPVPINTHEMAGGTFGISFSTDATTAWQAIAQSGVFSEGFQTTGSPQTQASAAFHAHTAIGKLNAEITPIGPSGCHCSASRCPGRSVAIVRPYNCRLSPTAKSQMSMTSCTSPSDSCVILPASAVMTAARSAFISRNRLPTRRTNSPRCGAGTDRQIGNAAVAALRTRGTSPTLAEANVVSVEPSIGERPVSSDPVPTIASPPIQTACGADEIPRRVSAAVSADILNPSVGVTT